MTRSSVKPIPMFIISSMSVCEAPIFEGMPGPRWIGRVGIDVGAGEGASAGGGVDRGALTGKAAVRGLLTPLLTEPAGSSLNCGFISDIDQFQARC